MPETKQTRRERRQAQIEAYAAAVDVDLRPSLANLFVYILERLDLHPERDGKKIKFQSFDGNHVREGHVKQIDMKMANRRLLGIASDLLNSLELYGPVHEVGSLDGFHIERCAARVLLHEIGEDWRGAVMRHMLDIYGLNPDKPKKQRAPKPNYRHITDNVSIRISSRKVHIEAKLAEGVYFRNKQITLHGKNLPKTLLGSLSESPLSALFDGEPYGNAFRDEIILQGVLSPSGLVGTNGTIIIEIKPAEIPIFSDIGITKENS